MLQSISEVREFKHLDTSSMRRSGASQRLSKVYSKIQAWEWLSGEFEAALMLDTDLYIKHALDEALYKVSHCKILRAFIAKEIFHSTGQGIRAPSKPKKGWIKAGVVEESMEPSWCSGQTRRSTGIC